MESFLCCCGIRYHGWLSVCYCVVQLSVRTKRLEEFIPVSEASGSLLIVTRFNIPEFARSTFFLLTIESIYAKRYSS